MSKDSTRPIVIVGAGGAGVAAAERLAALRREGLCDSEVVVVAKEAHPPYSLCTLPALLAGRAPDEALFYAGRDFFGEAGARHLLGTLAAIDPVRRRIRVRGERPRWLDYHRLLLATGSRALRPRIPGVDLDGVFTLNDLDSTRALAGWAGRTRRAVVIGAGFTGIETALALRDLGNDVVMVEALERLLPRMVDAPVSERIARLLRERGIDLRLSAKVRAILGRGRVEGVALEDGARMDADTVVLALGVVPDIAFLGDSGIEVGEGVLVDRHLRSSAPEVFAAGDIAEFRSGKKEMRRVPTWPNAVVQGRVAAENIAGGYVECPDQVPFNVLSVGETLTLSAGSTAAAQPSASVVEASGGRARVVAADGKIAGFQLFGDVSAASGLLRLLERDAGSEEAVRLLRRGWGGGRGP